MKDEENLIKELKSLTETDAFVYYFQPLNPLQKFFLVYIQGTSSGKAGPEQIKLLKIIKESISKYNFKVISFSSDGTVSAVDLMINKVIEESTLIKIGENRPIGNFTGVSNNMETICTLKVLKKMKDHQIFDKLESITKDRDNKTKKVIENIGQKICNRVFTYYDDDGEEITVKSHFYEMELRLIKWMNICLKEECDDKRVSMWLSTVDHYL